LKVGNKLLFILKIRYILNVEAVSVVGEL
jgi:hypothetical protein